MFSTLDWILYLSISFLHVLGIWESERRENIKTSINIRNKWVKTKKNCVQAAASKEELRINLFNNLLQICSLGREEIFHLNLLIWAVAESQWRTERKLEIDFYCFFVSDDVQEIFMMKTFSFFFTFFRMVKKFKYWLAKKKDRWFSRFMVMNRAG